MAATQLFVEVGAGAGGGCGACFKIRRMLCVGFSEIAVALLTHWRIDVTRSAKPVSSTYQPRSVHGGFVFLCVPV